MKTNQSIKRYRATLSVTYTQEHEANALTEEQAVEWMKEAFDPTRCWGTAEFDVSNVEEITPWLPL